MAKRISAACTGAQPRASGRSGAGSARWDDPTGSPAHASAAADAQPDAAARADACPYTAATHSAAASADAAPGTCTSTASHADTGTTTNPCSNSGTHPGASPCACALDRRASDGRPDRAVDGTSSTSGQQHTGPSAQRHASGRNADHRSADDGNTGYRRRKQRRMARMGAARGYCFDRRAGCRRMVAATSSQ